jgi:hypothetical protein
LAEQLGAPLLQLLGGSDDGFLVGVGLVIEGPVYEEYRVGEIVPGRAESGKSGAPDSGALPGCGMRLAGLCRHQLLHGSLLTAFNLRQRGLLGVPLRGDELGQRLGVGEAEFAEAASSRPPCHPGSSHGPAAATGPLA